MMDPNLYIFISLVILTLAHLVSQIRGDRPSWFVFWCLVFNNFIWVLASYARNL